ncbi:MAG: phosphate acyltransferase PlsX [Sediminibacterium sp.]|nr:phosphate acyltransferase PlsX [Sediminibacterium sp.]
MVKIGLDMMGGDYAPLEAVKGIKLLLESYNLQIPFQLVCLGDEKNIAALFKEYEILDTQNVIIYPTSQVVTYHEQPTKAIKEKPDSSIFVGFKLLSENKIDAFISAGNTGAMLVGAKYFLQNIKGILRPTLATLIPKLSKKTSILLDVGLNTDCKPAYLNQFATIAHIYATEVLKINNPIVGLLNIGEEEGKGDTLSQHTYPLLKENSAINFKGNIEGRDIFTDNTDIIVCDGFVGNIVLKLAESLYSIAEKRNLLGDEFLQKFHYENYGGTPILGISKPVIIGHGISNHTAFANMICLAEKIHNAQFCKIMEERFTHE